MRSWLFVALVLIGCSSREPTTSGAGSAVGSAAPGGSATQAPVGSATQAPIGSATQAPGSIELFVDDVSVARVTAEQIAKWPRLDALVPEDARRLGTWQVVYLKGGSPKPVELARPSATYPELVPAVFPGETGAASFGMFDPVELAKHGTPGLRQDAIHEIRIKLSKEGRGGEHQGGGGSEADPMKLVLTFKTAAGDKVLTGEKIMAIPRDSMPGNAETKGWPLTKLLTAAGITKYSKLVLIDAAGTSLNVAKTDFDDKTTIPFIKLNRQGSLRFRMMKKQGEGWQAAGDLRALATIKVE